MGLWVIALIRVVRSVKVFRQIRRTPWRALESAWMYIEMRERSAAVLLRDPTTGEQAALHVQRLPHRKAMPPEVLLPVWFAGDFASGGVITPAGGGAFMYARPYRAASARRAGLERTLHEELTVPIAAPYSLRGRAREDFVRSAEWELAQERRQMQKRKPWQRQRDRITVYDSFDLQELRANGHVPAPRSDDKI